MLFTMLFFLSNRKIGFVINFYQFWQKQHKSLIIISVKITLRFLSKKRPKKFLTEKMTKFLFLYYFDFQHFLKPLYFYLSFCQNVIKKVVV